jgi:methionyl-tRNA formyltransferase
MTEKKLLVLCNSLLGLPALDALLRQGVVAGVGLPALDHEATERLLARLAQSPEVPVQRFEKLGLKTALESWVLYHQPDAVLVFTFPWRIPVTVLELPRQGFLNFHFGLLPQYRGADAIFWTIRNREAAGGITVHRMEAGFDTGPVADRLEVPLSTEDTYGMYLAKLAAAGAGLALQVATALSGANAELSLVPQDEALAVSHPTPSLPHLLISWDEPANQVRALIKAANPWNKGAYTGIRQMPLRITEATALDYPDLPEAQAGTIMHADPQQGIFVRCGDGRLLRLDILCLEEGFCTGAQFAGMGIRAGERFEMPSI